MLEETGAEPRLVQELEDFGIIKGEVARAASASTTRPSARSCARCPSSPRYGVAGRNLRVFKSSAEREAALLQQILAPALRSRNPERRKEAVEALENLAAVASHLKHLLLVRDLRQDRQVTWTCEAYIRDIPDFPKPGIVFKDITPLLLDPRALDFAGDVELAELRAAAGRRPRRGRRGARVHPRRARVARELGVRASCPRASRASCRARRSPPSTSSSTASTRWRCTPTRCATARGCCCTTTCWRPAARRARAVPSWPRARARVVAGCAFLVELSFLGGREKLAPYDVHTLIAYDAE